MMALLFLGMFLLACFGISVAVLVAGQVSAQRAADAAALAGCLDLPSTPAAYISAANYGTSSGGGVAGATGGLNASTTANMESGNGAQTFAAGYPTVVSSSATPAGGGTPIANGRIDVVIQRSQPALPFGSDVIGNQTIKAAAACQRKEGGLPVLFSLASNGKDTLKVNGGTNLDLGTGGIAVNSLCTSGCGGGNEGFDVIGSATVKAEYAATGDGKANVNGTLTLDGKTPGTISQGPTVDPFSSVSEPSAPASTGNCTVSGGTTTCTPGKYTTTSCGSPPASGCFPGSGTIVLQAGLYYLAGGGWQVSAGASVTGTGVTIFNGCNSPSGGTCSGSGSGQCGNVSLSPGNSSTPTTVELVPGALSGAGARLVFFQSRGCGTGGPNCNSANTFCAGGDVTIGLPPVGATPCGGQTCGVFYLPGGEIVLGPQGSGSNTGDSINVAMVANTLDLHGPITFNNPFIPSGTVSHGDVALVPFP